MRSGILYISQRAIKKSFCGAFFKKRQRKTALFFLRSFFFCASCVKRKSDRMRIDVAINQRRMYEKSNFSCHPERSEAESNFFVLDPKRHCVPFAPHCVRSSTTLRMTRTKKRRAKQGGIYEQLAHNVRFFFSTHINSSFIKGFITLHRP